MRQIHRKLRSHVLWLLLLSLAFLFAACGEHPDLPTVAESNPGDFGANDTLFVRVGPDWDNTRYTWDSPEDLQMGRDGMIYVLDHAPVSGYTNGRVVQMLRDGTILNDDLFAETADTTNTPLGIGQDSKLNLYMVNGTNAIYAWNQFNDLNGVAGVVQSFRMRNLETGVEVTVDNSKPYYEFELELSGGNYEVIQESIVITEDPDSIAHFSNAYVFYADTTRSNSQFTDVDANVDESGLVYVTDRQTDRIITIAVHINRILLLEGGIVSYSYYGEYQEQVLSFGQGQGSTNNPTCIASEGLGSQHAIYFTQVSGNFLVQKVKGIGTNWFFDITTSSSEEPEVLQLGYFGAPQAIAIAERDERGLGLFFVADSAQHRVSAFHPNGFLFREVATEKMYFDLAAGDSLSALLDNQGYLDDINPAINPDLDLSFIAEGDTSIAVQFSLLNGPKGVATWNGVVYVADSGNDRILRFQRSDTDSYLPDEGD